METITLQKLTRNVYGEAVVSESHDIKCQVSEVNRMRRGEQPTLTVRHDLEAFIQPHAAEGVTELLYDDIQFSYQGRTYTPQEVQGVKDFDGKVDHYRLALAQAG